MSRSPWSGWATPWRDLLIGRGNCPLGPLQQRLGDPDPLFELVFPARTGKAAIPVLIAVALGGVAIFALRSV